MDIFEKKTCADCAYFHGTVCGYFDQYANENDYACKRVYDQIEDSYLNPQEV